MSFEKDNNYFESKGIEIVDNEPITRLEEVMVSSIYPVYLKIISDSKKGIFLDRNIFSYVLETDITINALVQKTNIVLVPLVKSKYQEALENIIQ